ncbi:MAG: hypothetical protein CSA62_04735 [Planctomycetota bacterium]|nr:MAG: hypothetical protein CSA62_04735 [Planctomycetota bacterium]
MRGPEREIIETTLASYAEGSPVRRALERLAQEFAPALIQLRRRHLLATEEDHPEHRCEILHECVGELLAEGREPEARPGAGLRRVQRAQLRLRRRTRLESKQLGSRLPLSLEGLLARRQTLSEAETLPPKLSAVPSELLEDPELRKRNGTLHLGRLSSALGAERWKLGHSLREEAARLGRGPRYAQFWRNRLRDAALHTLELLCERDSTNLLPGVPDQEDPLRRLERILARIGASPEPEPRDGPVVRLRRRLRALAAQKAQHLDADFLDELYDCAAKLGADSFRLAISRCYLLLERGLASAAVRSLMRIPAPMRSGQDAGQRRSRELRFALALARCLVAIGRPGAAYRALQRMERRSRDPLLLLNLSLLSRRLGWCERTRRHIAQLRSPCCHWQQASPVLSRNIRRLLANID